MRHLLSIFGLFFVFGVLAQSSLEFELTTHDFGEIKEDDGYAEFTFHFVNVGEQPVKITNVKASCGCTTPGWTREEVMPGDSGFVTARYNPRNRPGRFRKSLRITTSDPGSDQTLYIMGFVKPKPKTPEEEFPIAVGNLRFKYQGLNIGKITTEKPVVKKFDVYNAGDTAVSLAPDGMMLPAHIKAKLEPSFINPKQFGKLLITYDPIKKADYGFVSDHIILDTASQQALSAMAIIEEFFPEMNAEELDQAPRLEVSDRTFDFGKVDAGTVIETSFEVTNSGKEQLKIRAIKSNCDCLTYEMKHKRLKKGKTRSLSISLDTSTLRGNQYKSLTIYANDPMNPVQIITVTGNVRK